MSYIPDCRTDEAYNQKYLGEKDAMFLQGYDFALKMTLPVFDNLNVFYEEFEFKDEDVNLARFLDKHEQIRSKLAETVEYWHEMQRDEIVTSMIDAMDEDYYNARKQEVDNGATPYFKEVSDDEETSQ